MARRILKFYSANTNDIPLIKSDMVLQISSKNIFGLPNSKYNQIKKQKKKAVLYKREILFVSRHLDFLQNVFMWKCK